MCVYVCVNVCVCVGGGGGGGGGALLGVEMTSYRNTSQYLKEVEEVFILPPIDLKFIKCLDSTTADALLKLQSDRNSLTSLLPTWLNFNHNRGK